MTNPLLQFLSANWTAGIEILLLAVSIYYGYLYFRGTRGAKVFTGLAILFIFLTLVSQILNLTVISWLLRSLTAFIAVALVVIFQPELRRALAELGSNHFFSSARQNRETIDIVADAVFELANKQLGQREDLDRTFGLRHRAGLGITEESDAIAIVVSEETGNISVCHRGKIERGFKPGNLEKRLGELLLRGDESNNDEEELIETEKNVS